MSIFLAFIAHANEGVRGKLSSLITLLSAQRCVLPVSFPMDLLLFTTIVVNLSERKFKKRISV